MPCRCRFFLARRPGNRVAQRLDHYNGLTSTSRREYDLGTLGELRGTVVVADGTDRVAEVAMLGQFQRCASLAECKHCVHYNTADVVAGVTW
jgi:hypothetical protein